MIWVSGIELIGTIMGVGEPRLSNTPEVCVIPLLESAVEAVSLGSSVSVSMADTGPRMYYSIITTGKSADSSGWLPGSISISPFRSFSVSH